MRITYINPSMNGRRRRAPFEPLAFAVLSGLTPGSWEQRFHDETVESVPFAAPTDLVAISAHTYTARRAYQIARRYRERGVPVVLGGYHPTLAPAEAERFADAIVTGEAEDVWPTVLADAAAGRLRRRYEGRGPATLAGLRYDRTLFAGKPYRHVRSVQFGRGCPFSCEFCSVHRFFGGRCRQRPVPEVVEEIRGLPRGHLFIVDDNLYVGPERTRELLEGLVPLRRRWTCQASIDIAEDPEMVRLLARSGCHSVLIGFESITAETLDRMSKSWNRGPSRYERVVARLHEHGILTFGTFIFGYDDEPREAFRVCADFVLRSKIFLAAFNILQPTPGTPPYARLLAEGRLGRTPWWLDPDSRFFRPVYRPRGISAQELEDLAHDVRMRTYSYGSILRRALGTAHVRRSPGKLAFYLFANLQHRREVRRIGFRPFGAPEEAWEDGAAAPAAGLRCADG